ncbi:uncharacterized protein LOC119609605 [Lucilia sericata]|uniref:uncharacterized protein LOC119609605 n=1 Tax=Lucilia sericata TaxID=13632 RepID=UPI0018A84254|nr:uncharacterized protein LOC119609605 [Lucilia sericata]
MAATEEDSNMSCILCVEPDNDEIVCCDKCDGWYHFSCVGVTEAVADIEWICKSCIAMSTSSAAELQQSKEVTNNNLVSSVLYVPSNNNKENTARVSKDDVGRRLSVSSKNSMKAKRLSEEMKLLEEEERLLLQKETILNKKKELLKQMENGSDDEEYNQHHDWLPGVVPEVSTKIHHNPISTKLTREQIASRQSFARDLEKFNDNPEDWPLFFATYQQTTEICGFSDSENLLRLRNSLEGDALKAVRNLLFHASCVPQIIETIRIKFGRPEIVLNILLKRVRELSPIKENKLESLVDFALEVQNVIATMKSANLKDYLNNPEIEQELVLNLPGIIAAFWGMHKLSLSSCNLENFGSWLFQLAQGANSVIVPERYGGKPTKRGNVNTHFENENETNCIACGNACDNLPSCQSFKNLSRSKKWELVRTYRLCRRCLTPHYLAECQSTQLCGINGCQYLHHPLLHKNTLGICNIVRKPENAVLFRIVPVILYGNGTQIKTYAFFDDGSSLTLMEDSLLRDLNLKGTPSPLCLKWTGDTHRYEEDSEVLNLKIAGDPYKKALDLNNVHTVKSLDLPKQSLDVAELKMQYSYLKDIPLSSYVDEESKLLIGLNNSWLGASMKIRERNVCEPVAEKTRLGWSVKGPCTFKLDTVGLNAFHTCTDANECEELLRTVKRYILLDNMDVAKNSQNTLSAEDVKGLNLLKKNTRKLGDRYETRLLWKQPRIAPPDSFPMAKRRALCLSSKLAKDPQLYAAMEEKILEYLCKGYAVPLPNKARSKNSWYLPIFPVVNPSKPAKLRIVWDAAAKVNGVSLNSMLMKGPDFTSPLVDVLRRFRQHRFAISGDIKEMYHQVKIHKIDQNYQRFLWYEKGKAEPNECALTVMTFGATCSPSAAQFVKNLNAEEFRTTYSRAVEAIVHNHYVDDLLDGTDTEKDVVQLAKDVRFIHAQGGFTIRNWRSNSKNVLQALNAEPDDLNLDVDKAMG